MSVCCSKFNVSGLYPVVLTVTASTVSLYSHLYFANRQAAAQARSITINSQCDQYDQD